MNVQNEFVITKTMLYTIAKGACIMASGGGGSYQVTKNTIDTEFEDDYTLTCVPASSMENDAWLVASACMFPPSALTKSTDTISPIINVCDSLENWCVINGQGIFTEFSYFHPLEVGATNTVAPIIAVAKMNKTEGKSIKIIDADTAGRAIPTLPLIVFTAYDNPAISWFPNYVASKTQSDGSCYTGQFNLPDGTSLEDAFITLIIDQFDKLGGFSVFPMNGETLKSCPSVDGTLSDAYNVGLIYDNSAYTQEEKAQQIVNYFNNRGRKSKIIFTGTVDSITTQQSGTDNGSIIINGTDSCTGYIFELKVSNENILAYKYTNASDKGDPYILGPDSMSYVPLNTDMDVYDNSDLTNYLNCPNAPEIKLNVIGISAPLVITSKADLIKHWTEEWALMGFDGTSYTQPWLNE